MTKEQLKQGIAILYDMEVNNYMMTKAMNDLTAKINSLGHHNQFEGPMRTVRDTISWDSDIGIGCVIAMVAGIIGCISGCSSSSGFFGTIEGIIEQGIIFFIVGLIVGSIIVVIIDAIKVAIENDKRQQEYDNGWAYVNELARKDDIRVQKELKQKDFLISERSKLAQKKSQALATTDKFYNAMGIDSIYRNLIPIGYMYEYSRLGISTQLEGVDGLYYLVRRELRDDQLMCKLDDISYKLDQVIDNQRVIYKELKAINSKCSKMIESSMQLAAQISASNQAMQQSLNSMAKNSAVTAYNSERSRRELEHQGFMKSLGYY